MKTLRFIRDASLFALIGTGLAVIGIAIYAQARAQVAVEAIPVVTEWLHNPPPKVVFPDVDHGEWLQVRRFNTTDESAIGFSPSYTYLISDFRPVIKPVANGKWQIISFECNVCGDIP